MVNSVSKNRLNTTKSPGPDKVNPKMLYELANVIDKPLFTIFKKSFETGIVPENWKVAIIRDGPFNFQGGVMVFCFVQNFFSGQHES